jgi:signal transduction histidine kinase
MSPMVGLWLPLPGGREELALVRLVRMEDRTICQGILLDAARLGELLLEEVRELFPDARVLPVREAVPAQLDRTMTTLPLQLDPGAVAPPDELGWTALRVGLGLAWAAALLALAAVGLGGWSLLDLSQRRIRFVSAVTHELRTPLTTLRLYLDLLVHGVVREERQREEYLRTLYAETDRLSRLVSHVLDYSRLEHQDPRVSRACLEVGAMLGQLRDTWELRCQEAGKELVVEDGLPAGAKLLTDCGLLEQVVGNLIDNACKHTRGAEDCRVWVRAVDAGGEVCLEVEDRGPGVPAGERRAIFRPFRRGREADATTGGVGLGLALAARWARLLGGTLTLEPAANGTGACFQVRLPRSAE